jgi:hypothetical protein
MIAFQGSYPLNLPKQFEDDSFARSIAGLYEGRARMCTAKKLFWWVDSHFRPPVLVSEEEASWCKAVKRIGKRAGSPISLVADRKALGMP